MKMGKIPKFGRGEKPKKPESEKSKEPISPEAQKAKKVGKEILGRPRSDAIYEKPKAPYPPLKETAAYAAPSFKEFKEHPEKFQKQLIELTIRIWNWFLVNNMDVLENLKTQVIDASQKLKLKSQNKAMIADFIQNGFSFNRMNAEGRLDAPLLEQLNFFLENVLKKPAKELYTELEKLPEAKLEARLKRPLTSFIPSLFASPLPQNLEDQLEKVLTENSRVTDKSPNFIKTAAKSIANAMIAGFNNLRKEKLSWF